MAEFKQFRDTCYSVSTNGLVRNDETNRILKPCDSSHGYLSANLHIDKKSKMFLVSRLVAEVWLENPNQFLTIDHIDRNKHNNNVSNLRWASRQTQNINQNKHRTKNNTGIIGVMVDKQHTRFRASIIENGKQINKSFSINKHGKDYALALAYTWRKNQEERVQAYIDAK